MYNKQEPSIEPISWSPQPTLGERFKRAVTVPALAGSVVLIAIVVTSIIMVMVRPHDGANAISATQSEPTAEPLNALSGSAEFQATDGSDQSEQAITVFVHVVGEVKSPGVVELAADARVEAAIDLAGGPTEDAALEGINLARTIDSGEQIVVPDEEMVQQEPQITGQSFDPSVTAEININTADAATLETLPRVGPVLAAEIIGWRQNYGDFQTVDQLLDVPGIGAKTLDNLRPLVRV